MCVRVRPCPCPVLAPFCLCARARRACACVFACVALRPSTTLGFGKTSARSLGGERIRCHIRGVGPRKASNQTLLAAAWMFGLHREGLHVTGQGCPSYNLQPTGSTHLQTISKPTAPTKTSIFDSPLALKPQIPQPFQLKPPH